MERRKERKYPDRRNTMGIDQTKSDNSGDGEFFSNSQNMWKERREGTRRYFSGRWRRRGSREFYEGI